MKKNATHCSLLPYIKIEIAFMWLYPKGLDF